MLPLFTTEESALICIRVVAFACVLQQEHQKEYQHQVVTTNNRAYILHSVPTCVHTLSVFHPPHSTLSLSLTLNSYQCKTIKMSAWASTSVRGLT